MGLIDFFSNIINKIKGREVKKLPPPQTIRENNYEPEVEKNAYVNAYTKNINKEKSEFKISSDGTRIKFIDIKTNKTVDVQRMVKIKEGLDFYEQKIDIYKAIYAIGNKDNRKLKRVYFALPYGKAILDLYKGGSKKASLKKKLKIMFNSSIIDTKRSFLGIIIEDDIYNNYSILKSSKLEEYIKELEKKRKMIKVNKQKSKEQVKQTISKKEKMQTAKTANQKSKTRIDNSNIKKVAKTKEIVQNTKKAKNAIKNLNKMHSHSLGIE